MKKLSPIEEIGFLKELQQDSSMEQMLISVRECFNVLQMRSQMLLGLVTICLTITGFSGMRIAEAGFMAKLGIVIGLVSILITALLLFLGPLHVQWTSQFKASTIKDTIEELIIRRNIRTKLYHLATFFLVVGICGYVLAFGYFLVS